MYLFIQMTHVSTWRKTQTVSISSCTITPSKTKKIHLQYYIATDNRRALRNEHSTSCSYLYSIHHNYLYVGRYVRITRAVQHVQNMNKRRCQLSCRAPLHLPRRTERNGAGLVDHRRLAGSYT